MFQIQLSPNTWSSVTLNFSKFLLMKRLHRSLMDSKERPGQTFSSSKIFYTLLPPISFLAPFLRLMKEMIDKSSCLVYGVRNFSLNWPSFLQFLECLEFTSLIKLITFSFIVAFVLSIASRGSFNWYLDVVWTNSENSWSIENPIVIFQHNK